MHVLYSRVLEKVIRRYVRLISYMRSRLKNMNVARTISQPFTECDTKLEEYQTSFTTLRDHLVTLVAIDGAVGIDRMETQLGQLGEPSDTSFFV